MPKLSVVIPTLNCIHLLPAHVDSMKSWLGLADEIVVVDSFSDDGTPAYLKKHLKHRNVRILSHPRGLYQSWNFGISQTTGDWVYVSTVGDSITKTLLQHLCQVGESLECDVVASRPTFINVNNTPASRQIWPIDHILKSASGRKPLRLGGPETFLFALYSIPCAVLGSSASNVYRGSHLRERPFPTEFGTVGDTAWSLRYGLTTRYGFTPEIGSYFRLHPKAYSASEYAVNNLVLKMADYAVTTLTRSDHAAETTAAIAKCQLIETASAIVRKLRTNVESPITSSAAPSPVASVTVVPAEPDMSVVRSVKPAVKIVGREITKPRTLNLQAIDICNSRCVMCNIWKDGKREKMGLDELRRYLTNPFFSEVGHVGVTGGEPTLRTDLVDLYRMLPDCLPKLAGTSFITHGMQTARAVDFYTSIHDEYRKRKLNFEGMVSIDGVGPVHDLVRGRKGAFEAASQTLLALKQRNVRVIAACTVVRSNVYGLHDLLDWGKSNDVYVRFRVAEFIRRLYNEPCGDEIRSFDHREIRHLVSFFHLLLTEYETDETIKKTYHSILSLLTGGERLIGCSYRKGVAVNVDSRGGVASCAPKGEAFMMSDDLAAVDSRLDEQRKDVAKKHCAQCIHDYHDDWNQIALKEVTDARGRYRDLYEIADERLTTPELPVETLELGAMSQILLAGWYGTETAGDIAILRGIISEYLHVNPRLNFRLLSLYPYYTRTTLSEWPAELRTKVQVMDYVSEAAWQATVECDALVMAGGPLMDIGETQKILCLFKRFADLGKPRVVEGCGIGPLNQVGYRWNVCRIARLATKISVRDQASRDMLRSFGIEKLVEVRMDPATTFIRAQEVRYHGSESRIIRCFLRELTAEYPQALTPAQAMAGLAALLQKLLSWYPDHRIELWAMHHFPVGYDDRLFAQKLVKQIGNPRLTCVWKPRTPREILEAMAAAEFCVCMRFHSCVFASEVGVPFVAIDYTAGGKIKGFLDDVRQASRLCALGALDALDHPGFTAKLSNSAECQMIPNRAGVEHEKRPVILHIIQRVTGGGGARAMIALAKYSHRSAALHHEIVSLLPADEVGMAVANEADVTVVDQPAERDLRARMAAADVVLVHWWNVPELSELFRRDLPPMRLALWLHVGGYHSPQILTRELLSFADLSVACSPHTYAHPVFTSAEGQAGPSRSAMVLAGAEFARLQGITARAHDGFRVGYVGTVDPVKMHGDFVAMSCAVNVSNVKFVVCGGGDPEWLSEQARERGRISSFEFKGSVENIRDVLETLDVYGYPLCADTYAAAELNLQEAMYAGLPVVTFPHGGIGRLIRHGETGLLVNSADEYTRAIEELYRNPAERARLGRNAAQFARAHWGAENAAREFNQYFHQLLILEKRERIWGEREQWPSGGRDVHQNLAIHPGVRMFVESVGEAKLFLQSLTSTRAEDLLQAEEQIAAMPRLMHYTGILAYRNAWPKDPFLQLWTGLGFLRSGNFKFAIGCFQLAAYYGLTHWRIHWYRALAAERAGALAEALAAVALVQKAAPDFRPALSMRQRLSSAPTFRETNAPARSPADVVLSNVEQAERFLRQGLPMKARERLQAALEIMPHQVGLMEILCDLECRLGNLDAARLLFGKISQSEPARATPRMKSIRLVLGASSERRSDLVRPSSSLLHQPASI
jgi:polysaccharide pyruvyl transferase WcaK-like protein/glycosyltransferase involved in cell wall biosynthesis/MoaA/NifB/PqqE/SkfB family radical SAM enzyme